MGRPLKRTSLALALAIAGSVAAAGAQVFRGGTDLVLLTITVVDGANRLVAGLEQEDFQVSEDGVPQQTTNFSRQPQPIALSLLIDCSTSMEPKLAVAQEAAAGFVKRLGPQDVAQVIEFDNQATILQPFTADRGALERAIARTVAEGSTSLYNAIYIALGELKRVRSESGPDIRRQAIVLLSDGQDTTSIIKYDDVLDAAKRSEAVVYAIGIVQKESQKERGWDEANFVLRSLSRETGGRAFTVADPRQLPAVYGQIADELANQYTLAYVSKNSKRDGAWRRISVQVARGGMVARTKAGYFGPKGTQ